MDNKSMKKDWSTDVLCYRETRQSPATVWRHYCKWRESQVPPIPDRCDNEDCRFHTEKPYWNGDRLPLILDHRNGNNSDNRPKNLHLLCANCDSQLAETRGGANRERIEKSAGGFSIRDKETGLRQYILPAEPGHVELRGREARFELTADPPSPTSSTDHTSRSSTPSSLRR
jgi:hypothetical protein